MLKPLILDNNNEIVKLNGQIKRGYHFAILPSRIGDCRYTITVHHGNLRLNHNVYNPDGGTWSCYPSGQQPHYDMQGGQRYEIQLTVGESFGRADKVEIVNVNIFQDTKFSYVFCPL